MWVGETSALETSRELALQTAKEEAQRQGLPEPHLLFECGSPEIRVILEKGEVVRVYYRNAEIPPIVTVTDLDLCDDTVRGGSVAYASLQEGGFELLPHIVDDVPA